MVPGIILVTGSMAMVGSKQVWNKYRSSDSSSLINSLALAGKAKTRLKNKPSVPSVNSSQASQIMGLSESEDDDNNVEPTIERNLAISLSSLGISSVGALFYPPLIVLSLPGLVYTAIPFFQYAYETARDEKKVGIALVDSISIGGTLAGGYLLAASLASSLVYLSQKVLIATQDRSRKSLVNILGEQPRFVHIVRDDIEIKVAFETLKIGDVVVIDAGQMIPIDGTIARGLGSVDQRALTGESQPVEKEAGDQVFTSTILLAGRLYVTVERTGEDTVAAKIGDVLNATADFRSTVMSRGQKIVDQGAIPTLALSAVALPLLGVQSALAVLFSSFGFSMRIAAPIGVLNFLRITSEQGILVKDGRSLELLSQIDTVVFDKTGTLTEEIPSIGRIRCEAGQDENELLMLVAACEQKQSHPLALAILREAKQRGLIVPPLHNATYEIGYGLRADVDQKAVHVGSFRYMGLEQIAVPPQYQAIEDACHEKGYSLLYVALNQQFAGVIEVVPTIRPEAAALIKDLHARQIETVIISGDQQKPTQHLAETVGIDRYFAEVLPQDKAQLVEQLQAEGRSVCFIGDGINDSIALKTATVGISMSGASTIATDTAGIVLMDGTLRQLTPLFNIAKQLDRNLTISTAATIIPGIICVGGVFFFHLGLVGSITIFNAGLLASVGNAFLPLVQHQGAKLIGEDPTNKVT